MITTIYITRHSNPIVKIYMRFLFKVNEQEINESLPLSPEGEIRAQKLSNLEC